MHRGGNVKNTHQTRTWSSNVIGPWRNIFVAATLADIDVLSLSIEDRDGFEDVLSRVGTFLTTGKSVAVDELGHLSSSCCESRVSGSSFENCCWEGGGHAGHGGQ